MSFDIWTRNLWVWPFAAMEIWRRTLEFQPAPVHREGPQWTTPARLALEIGALRLWDFSTGEAAAPVVVVAPYALHDAQLADLAPGHSLVETLLRHGCNKLYLVEWASATAATQHYGVDDLLAALNVAVDDIGGPLDMIGLCQGGWFSLVYAARFPAKTRRIVIAGAPVDMKAECSALSEPIDKTTDVTIERLILEGGGLVRGDRMAKLWPREETEEQRLVDCLQIEAPPDSESSRQAVAAFRKWDRRPLDLPGPYYREVVQRLYRDNLLAKGAFPALGKLVDLRGLDRPLFLLAGEQDGIAPPAQVLAVADQAGGDVTTALAPCGHLPLFMGRRTLENEWPRIARWLASDEAGG